MPLKRTRSVTTTTVPTTMVARMAKKKRRIVVQRQPRLPLLSAPGTPFPTRCRATLRYTSYFNLSVGVVGGAAQYLLRTNSAYDPDYTGVGTQPRGYDQYAALYNQYTVNKSTLKVVIAIPTTGATGQLMFGVSLKPDASGSPTLDQCADQPYTISKVTNQQTSAADRTIKMVWDRKKRFPKDDNVASLSGMTSGNPAESEFYQVWYHNAYSPLVAGASDVTFQYTMDMDIEFYELKAIPPS